jgi:pimaricinolide synthase PimS1
MDNEDKLRGYLKRVLGELRQVKRRLVEIESGAPEPIAIIGMGCRYPGGVRSPDDLWDLVAGGGDAISGFPTNRGWDLAAIYDPDPEQSGKTYSLRGGFLHDADQFDAEFFGISPREALAMDPQQRVVLETAWETFENAGIDPGSLQDSDTGVYIGTSDQDYAMLLHSVAEEVSGFVGTGNLPAVISGRVAYEFGLLGPAVTVGTACSSSLVAMHLAAQALRDGDCSLALAGGVEVAATPTLYIEFSRQRGLSPDGRCRSFAAAADGTGFSDGAGILLLERLSDAQRNGHTIVGVIRGSAVNQDGASNGLTAPNGGSQQRVIQQALAAARLAASEVDVVEAHGTGTTLGDPIEAQAILATYGQDRDQPLWLGSIKSNIGHTQAAAGTAGVIKMVMAMRHGVLPQTLHIDQPSPHVDWTAGAVSLLTESQPWQADRPLRAGVSSFGISGTNAHVILEQPPAPEPAGEAAGNPAPWLLSAKTVDALRAQAQLLAEHVRLHPELDVADIGYTLSKRSQFDFRAAVTAGTSEDRLKALLALADGDAPVTSVSGGKTALLFAGQGAQHPGMGKELYARHPVFAKALDEICAHFTFPLRDIMWADDPGRLNQTGNTQPALFAFEVALYRLLEHHGVRPDLLAGHSIGEIAAAHVAGVLTLADACTLVAARAGLMQSLPPGGSMIAINTTEQDVQPFLSDSVALAAVNTPESVVISGDAGEVRAAADHFVKLGVRTRELMVSHAFHSPHMDPVLDRFRATISELAFAAPDIPIVSTLTGQPVDTFTVDYWVQQVRGTVRFAEAVETLRGNGATTYLELCPDPALSQHVTDGTPIPLQRAAQSQHIHLMKALAQAHTNGVRIDWSPVHTGQQVTLPTYPFQRRTYWAMPAAPVADLSSTGMTATDHPLLTTAVQPADTDALIVTGRISLTTYPWPADQTVNGHTFLPATAFLDMSIHAADHLDCNVITGLTMHTPAILTHEQPLQLQLTSTPGDHGHTLTIHTRTTHNQPWTHHVTATLGTELRAMPAEVPWPPSGAEVIDPTDVLDAAAAAGRELGPAFQGLHQVWREGDHIYAEVSLPGEISAAGHGVHPILLETALLPLVLGDDVVKLPSVWEHVRLHATEARALRVHLHRTGDDTYQLDATDTSGMSVLTVETVTLRDSSADFAADNRQTLLDSLFRLDWTAMPVAADATTTTDHFVIEPIDPSTQDVVKAAHQATQDALALVQNWLSGERPGDSRLAVVTRSAVVVGEHEAHQLSGAAVWGLIRSAQNEHPGRLVLIDTDDTVPIPVALATGEPQLAIRDGQILLPRLARVPDAPSTFSLAPGGTVLITGGTGTLGALVARHLVTTHGARRLLLTSRRGLDAEGAAELARELTELGATVAIAGCDAADAQQLEMLLESIPAEHPLTAVIHTAGVLDDALITDLTPERVSTVLRPKVDAAWNLHQQTKHLDLQAFVLFSSAAGTLGAPGQANYAAANTFLDALAQHRAAHHLAATSLAWGLWEQTSGITGHLDDANLTRIRRTGMVPLTAQDGLALFDTALSAQQPTLMPARLDRRAIRAQAMSGALPPPLQGLVRVRRSANAQATGGGWARQLVNHTPARQHQLLLQLVRSQTAQVLGHATADQVDPVQAFKDFGFDSLTAVQLRNQLAAATGLALPPTLVFDHPNPAALATHLHDLLAPNQIPLALQHVSELEEQLGDLGADDELRKKVVARLEEVLARIDPSRASDEAVLDRISSASSEEIFSFINNEL